MSKELNITGPNREFESIKHIDENNIEFWTARELFPLLGYSRWESFEEVIGRARKSALNSGQIVENHFRDLTKMVNQKFLKLLSRKPILLFKQEGKRFLTNYPMPRSVFLFVKK